MKGISVKQLKDPVVLVAVGFGSGLAPKAPGTAGTLVAIPLFLLMGQFATFSDELATRYGDDSKIFAVSVKDRGAIPLAGSSGQAYWFSKATGEFVTYCERALP